ncbi:type VI secretion system baseplate subunit TssG [Vogesella mureinivorans]|uniref:type VI secretion system baseplate subunit TssG n=1 Tax=Vogesella mureinivorans TaxID=657276 RepID=UPI0011CC4EE3|nr:type VI secretion system baseplate subunit TssG [Vogesella mureinivorans]
MASQSGRSPRDLRQALVQDASQFGFFQAVRVLGLSSRRRRGPLPANLRFRTVASLSFPASELRRYQPDEAALDELTVSFMGLTGPSGALPVSYTELLLERKQHYRDDTLHAFFDMFSHRAMAMFYGAWRKYRFWLAAEEGEQDDFSRHLLHLGGVGLGKSRQLATGEGAVHEHLFLYFAGLLSQKPLSAQALQTVVAGLFGIPAALVQFDGQWLPLPPAQQSRLGLGECELGVSLFCGERVWDRQTKMTLRLGPMALQPFTALQPGGEGAKALQALLHFAVGHQLAVDVVLVLSRQAVPPPQLGGAQPLRLGGNSWLGKQPVDPDCMRYALLH